MTHRRTTPHRCRHAAAGTVLLGLAITGCGVQSTAVRTTAPTTSTLPSACTLVSAPDVSLYVALDDWNTTRDDTPDRSLCQLTDTHGNQVTTVVSALTDRRHPPTALCAPPAADS